MFNPLISETQIATNFVSQDTVGWNNRGQQFIDPPAPYSSTSTQDEFHNEDVDNNDEAEDEAVALFAKTKRQRVVNNNLTADEYKDAPSKLLGCKLVVEYIYEEESQRAQCGYYLGEIISVHAKSKTKPPTVDVRYCYDGSETKGFALEKGNNNL